MNLEGMTFECSPWEDWVEEHDNGSITAAELLTMFETEGDEAPHNVFKSSSCTTSFFSHNKTLTS